MIDISDKWGQSFTNEKSIPLENTIIISRLNMMKLNGENMCRKMKEYKCVIAGSFPLQCLIGEIFTNSDIDIYTHWENKDKSSPICTWIESNYNVKEKKEGPYIYSGIRRTVFYDLGSAIINIIEIEDVDVKGWIYNSFDLSFCMTMFDGTNLLYGELSKSKIGYITNIKTEYIQSDAPVCPRIDKYAGRGFTILSLFSTPEKKDKPSADSDSNDSDYNIDPIIEVNYWATKKITRIQIEKYKKRGYKVTTDLIC